MFPQGFLGTRADVLTDVVLIGFAVVPFVLYYAARLARAGDHDRHRRIQIASLVVLSVILVLFEINIRVKGGSQALVATSSFAATPGLRLTLLVHLAIAISTYVTWLALVLVSRRRYGWVLPGEFSALHARLGRWLIAGTVATSITGAALYVMAFVL